MNHPRSFKRMLGGVLLLSVVLSAPLPAQTIDVLWSNSLTAMNAGEWGKAHVLLTKAVQQYDKRAMTLFGAKFGWFWYHKGYCELKMRKYEEAMKSFEACYKKYPNGAGGPAGGGGDNKSVSFNHYHKKSLLKWGEAAQGAEDYQMAIRMYRKFLDERDPDRDSYERGAFFVNMSVCYFKLFKIPEGIENLETAIKNKDTFPTPNEGIMAGFQALVQACIEKTDEKSFIKFLDKNRADISLEPWQMGNFGPIFMKLAADALSSEMDRSAFELYALVPSTKASIGDVEARIASLGNIERPIADGSKILEQSRLKEDLKRLEGYVKTGKPPEVTALAATAYIHEQNGNARGSFAAYEQLELFYSKSPKREEYLYNLVRTSSIVGLVLTTEKYGSIFLKTFPDSQHCESVRSMMLTSLFFEGEYAKCIEVASIMIDKLPNPSKQHDICLHVLGGSYYYTGSYDKAQPLLEQHVKDYPESEFKMAACYFEGSNLTRLQFWTKAAELLDKFLTEYPDESKNIYMPFALYDRANCHYAEDDEMEPALEKLNKLESTFPTSEIMDMAFNLKGNVLQSTDELEEAEKYYLKALDLAERRENDLVAGEALYYLVGLIGQEKVGKKPNPRAKEAVPYYDKFWKQYGGDSPYKAQVAVAGVHAMTLAGRAQEALDRLQGVISELAQIQGAFGLEEAINSYTKAYLNEYSPEELKDHYYKFPGIDADNRAAQALLRIAIIGVYEEKVTDAKKEKDEAATRQANATIKVLFEDLKNDFQPKNLSNYILVRVGDYLRERTAAPRLAEPYYQEAIDREDQSYQFPALFGLADIYGRSENRTENNKAIDMLKRIYADAQEKEQKEKALHRIVTINAQKGDWGEVSASAKEYLDREKNYKRYSPEVSFLLAQSYDNRAQTENAIAAYTNVWAAYAGYMKISLPSVRRVMELTWKRDRPAAPPKLSDRQTSYEFGANFVGAVRLGKAYESMNRDEREMFDGLEALVKQFEDDPNVMNMEEVKKAKMEGRR